MSRAKRLTRSAPRPGYRVDDRWSNASTVSRDDERAATL